MTTGSKGSIRASRAWPGIAAPLGLTGLLAFTVWLFLVSVSTEQERRDADAVRLESYARLEAGELANRSRNLVATLVDNRLAARQSQERNLQLELRGVMDAVYRLLTAGLEKARVNTAARREVGGFPSGFSGVQNYLEIAGSKSGSDQAVAALRACTPELAALLPAGCSLTVVENNFQEHLSLGGGGIAENTVGETMTREFIWDDGGRGRHWTLQVRLNAPDAHPLPDAGELAAHLSEELGRIRLDRAAWRGWLVDRSGRDVAPFPRESGDMPENAIPFIDTTGEWVGLVESRRLVWMERSLPIDNQDLTTAIAVAVDRPAPALVAMDELRKDVRWSIPLGVLALLSAAGWVWFLRGGLAGARPQVPRSRVQTERANAGSAAQSRPRLVRDDSLSRVIPEVQGVIVADIDANGSVHVETVEGGPAPVRAKPQLTIPSGSLLRLQAIHRGGRAMRGSRVLDQARSQVLRELADRVRPVVDGTASQVSGAAARTGEKIPSMKSPGGWRKVEDGQQ